MEGQRSEVPRSLRQAALAGAQQPPALARPLLLSSAEPLVVDAMPHGWASDSPARWNVTSQQRKVLERTYRTHPYPVLALREQLGRELSVTPRQVQIWFQNRRQRTRRGGADDDVDDGEVDDASICAVMVAAGLGCTNSSSSASMPNATPHAGSIAPASGVSPSCGSARCTPPARARLATAVSLPLGARALPGGGAELAAFHMPHDAPTYAPADLAHVSHALPQMPPFASLLRAPLVDATPLSGGYGSFVRPFGSRAGRTRGAPVPAFAAGPHGGWHLPSFGLALGLGHACSRGAHGNGTSASAHGARCADGAALTTSACGAHSGARQADLASVANPPASLGASLAMDSEGYRGHASGFGGGGGQCGGHAVLGLGMHMAGMCALAHPMSSATIAALSCADLIVDSDVDGAADAVLVDVEAMADEMPL
ncbi:hypothetical protein KFE25_010852 [Diacronema lutheri]|uniref:Homeobox domain-containing protein n=2 Tax=Diacronema lutheri TaxID=2081491 RepID=A0A8J5XC15_DIALT|nr:hypothetical protein KFE25_010852 [Diacronema lutheri]